MAKKGVFKRLDIKASSNIEKIRYNAKDKLLKVYFFTGTIYLYKEVTEAEVAELIQADSVGKKFIEIIRDSKPYEKLS